MFFKFQILRSFKLEIEVDPTYHPKIIGRKGAVISKIRADHDVNIQFPERGDAQNIITITGYEQNATSAKQAILKIVEELVRLLFIFHNIFGLSKVPFVYPGIFSLWRSLTLTVTVNIV